MQFYVHNVPGRLRVRSPLLKRNKNISDDLKKTLSCINGVATVDINLTTGSLLIHYNPKTLNHETILEELQRKGFIEIEKAVTNDEYVKQGVTNALNFAGRVAFGSVLEKSLEGTALSYLAVLI